MIPNLSEEDKNDWDKQMRYYNRRQKRSNTWSAIRFYAGLLFAIVIVVSAIRACNEATWQPKPSDFVADSLYVDSVINGHSGLGPIESDTGSPEAQGAYDSMTKTEEMPGTFIRAIDDSVGSDSGWLTHSVTPKKKKKK